MDEDLKTYLRQMEERNVSMIAGVEERTASMIAGVEERTASMIAGVEERTAALIASEIGSLHTDIQNVEKRLGARLESIDSRLKLQAGLIQAGARAMARFSEFAENSEERWVALVTRVEALERRISEGNNGNGTGKT